MPGHQPPASVRLGDTAGNAMPDARGSRGPGGWVRALAPGSTGKGSSIGAPILVLRQ